jgi:hypothetical protein
MGETTRPDPTWAEVVTDADAALGMEEHYPLSTLPERVAALRRHHDRLASELVAARQRAEHYEEALRYIEGHGEHGDCDGDCTLHLIAEAQVALAASPEQETRE